MTTPNSLTRILSIVNKSLGCTWIQPSLLNKNYSLSVVSEREWNLNGITYSLICLHSLFDSFLKVLYQRNINNYINNFINFDRHALIWNLIYWKKLITITDKTWWDNLVSDIWKCHFSPLPLPCQFWWIFFYDNLFSDKQWTEGKVAEKVQYICLNLKEVHMLHSCLKSFVHYNNYSGQNFSIIVGPTSLL